MESDDYVNRSAFVTFPARCTVQLKAGCRVRLRFEPWPDPAWATEEFLVSSQRGAGSRKLRARERIMDVGVWPAGDVHVARYPVTGGRVRTDRVALPESGEVVHTLEPSRVIYQQVAVHDAATGTLIRDWQARVFKGHGGAHDLPRTPADADGVFQVPFVSAANYIEAPGYARAYWAPRGSKRAQYVKLDRGATLRVELEGCERPKGLTIQYNSPAGPVSQGWSYEVPMQKPEERRLNVSDLRQNIGDELTCIPAGEPWVIDHLPARSRLDLFVQDEEGCFTRAQVVTGEVGTETVTTVKVPRFLRRTVHALDRSGEPIPGARVAVHNAFGKVGFAIADAEGKATVFGMQVGRAWWVTLDGLKSERVETNERSDPVIVLRGEPKPTRPYRVLVLSADGEPVPGVRVQLQGNPAGGDMAITGPDGIATGEVAATSLHFVAVQWAPTVNGFIYNDPPEEDPIVYRAGTQRIPLEFEFTGTGKVEVSLRSGQRNHTYSFHVYGHGFADWISALKPGEYELKATLDGQTIERRFAVRAGEPVRVPLAFGN